MIKLPQKSHFKMDEACGLTGVKPYVLRFWESEFDQISPITSSSGQKLFSYDDVEKILFIKRLLFQEKLTIEEAKAKILLSGAAQSQTNHEGTISTGEVNLTPKTLEFDIEKLAMAKKQLQGVLEMTESLKSRHQWS